MIEFATDTWAKAIGALKAARLVSKSTRIPQRPGLTMPNSTPLRPCLHLRGSRLRSIPPYKRQSIGIS